MSDVRYNSKCVFCAKNDFYLYKLFLGDYNFEDLVIYRSPNFIVLPDIAPLIEGYLIIIPLMHVSCFGNILNEHFAEFQSVKNYISGFLTEIYTKPLFFEHGPAKPKDAGCCIDHAHMHCLPVNADLSLSISDKLSRDQISSINELCHYTEKRISYLFYENNEGALYSYPLTNESSILPSQYLRMVVAANLKLDRWDWRELITSKDYSDKMKHRISVLLEKMKGYGKERRVQTL
jgi:diadenosine tetraphosphate (Ap4A) HIT family hydrolase